MVVLTKVCMARREENAHENETKITLSVIDPGTGLYFGAGTKLGSLGRGNFIGYGGGA